MASKQEQERAVFGQFLELSGLAVDQASIRSGDPDLAEPDIICTVVPIGDMAFELTAIAESDFMQMSSLVSKANQILDEQVNALEVGRTERLRGKFRNADIVVSIQFDGGLRAIKSRLSMALEAIESLPDGYDRDEDLRLQLVVCDRLRRRSLGHFHDPLDSSGDAASRCRCSSISPFQRFTTHISVNGPKSLRQSK